VDDRAAIEELFRGYEGAWASLDADSLRRVQDLSAADVARVRASMNDARQFQVTVQIRDVKLDNDGRHATVTAGVRRMMIPKRDAKPTDISTTSTFTLEKRGDGWVIVALR
jgi:ketosteroid isomerase-like protein